MQGLPERIAGRYRPVQDVARGAMARVIEAVDERDGRTVALKLLRPTGVQIDEELIKRFIREAKACVALGGHPGIVKVYDAGLASEINTLYISMELIRGQTLAERVNRGLDRDEAVRLIEGVARAVSFAHEKGVIHRDLKPDNIMIDEKGEPRLIDFGLVKALDSGGTQLTKMGQVLGSPAYMSPEQITDARLCNQRTDIYGLGVLLYFVLLGKPPFEGNALDVLEHVMQGTYKSPREVDPTIDQALDAIVKWAMANEPDKRPPSAAAFAGALALWRRKRAGGAEAKR